ncbi:AbrB/MazE/SpoVT family DNA-binding domain-containing protein [Candidatus Bathyarchaeota archaeon]|nr:AbrB/MazE/SpoVT family DNA-binding domain-containing protein [Candidatus Bathyarchaeota archaeon]
MQVEIKSVDSQGRILLPKDWRNRYLKGKKAIIIYKGDLVEIRPFTKSDLTKYFDKVEVDLKSDLSDWHKVKKELQSV